MRRVFVLAVALALLLLVDQAAKEAFSEGFDPFSLAAVGFVVLAAFTVGELGGQLGLPKITGYILSGVVLGPQVAPLILGRDVLSGHVVDDMKVFNTLALGLIALTAGLELNLRAIRRVLGTLFGTLAAKLPLLILLVGGTAVALESAFGFLGLATLQAQLAFALILAILGIGTSPAIVLAVSNESGSKGRLTDLVLAMSVVKDLVVVVSLALGLAVAGAAMNGGQEFDIEVLVKVAEELGGSLIVGAALGGLLILYLRYVRQEMLLVVLVAVLIGAELAHVLHLELLLVFITAGFTVNNASSLGHALHHPLERVALPVFVVFFTTAGATVDLEASLALLPLAVALVSARMLAYFLAARFGAWLGGEAPGVRDNAWITYWPQAGITLGLVTLARQRLPEIGDALEQTGFAVVALNLLAGPIMVGLGLRRSGEAASPQREETPVPAAEPSPSADTLSLGERQPLPEVPEPAPEPHSKLGMLLETEPLSGTVGALARDLEGAAEDFITRRVQPRVEQLRTLVDAMLANDDDVVVTVRRALADQPAGGSEGWEEDLESLRATLVERLRELPLRLVSPLSDGLLVARPSDGLIVRMSRWQLRTWRQLTHRGARTRAIRLQVIGRHELEPAIAASLRALTVTHFTHHARMLGEVRAAISDGEVATARERVEQLAHQWAEATRRSLVDPLRNRLVATAELAAEAGAPGARASQLRLSSIQSRLVNEVEGGRQDARRWQVVVTAGLETLRAEALVAEAETVLGAALQLRVREPLTILRDRILPLAEQAGNRLEAVHGEVEAGDETLTLEATLAKIAAGFPRQERKRLDRARAAFGRLTRHTRLPEDLARLRAAAPERLDLLPNRVLRSTRGHVERITVVSVPFAERMETTISGVIGRVRDAMAPAEALVVASEGRLRDATHLASYGVEAAFTGEPELDARRATAVRAVARGRSAATRLVDELIAVAESAEKTATEAAEAATGELRALVRDHRPSAVSRVRSTFRARQLALRGALTRNLAAARHWAEQRRRRLARSLDWVAPPIPVRDAGTLGRTLAESAPPPPSDLPAIYLKVCELSPVEDRRLAVARAAGAAQVASWLGIDGRNDRTAEATRGKVLVEGPRGSGRTSFLNMLERDAKIRRVVRIDATFHPRDEGLVGALSAELGCPDYPLAVVQALLTEPTLVLVDDLAHHVLPTPRGVHELEELLRIVVDTTRQVAWVVSAESQELSFLAETVPLLGVFIERYRLDALDGTALAEVVEARTDLAGIELDFGGGDGLFVRAEVRAERAKRRYFDALAEAADGNLREALLLHLRSLRMDEASGRLLTSLPSTPKPCNLGGLPPEGLMCLATIARFGPMLEEELAEVLLVDREMVRRHTSAFVQATLLLRDERQLLRLPLDTLSSLRGGLGALGLLGHEATS